MAILSFRTVQGIESALQGPILFRSQQHVFPNRRNKSHSARYLRSGGGICCSDSTASTDHAQSIGLSKNMGSFGIRIDLMNEMKVMITPQHVNKASTITKEMELWISEIQGMFRSMNDGEISVSPYDTAWVALVPALDGSKGPQFPKCLQWIIDNQFSDGSWGDSNYFSFFDRTINTLGCIVALKTWEMAEMVVTRGLKFLQENLKTIEMEEDAHMPIGFEIVFPTMLIHAQVLGLDLPYDAPIILKIASKREKKLMKIPMDVIHNFHTPLLYSLEGLHEQVDWEKIVKLQNEDGSFLTSPASTAACLLHTKNEKALCYLDRVLNRFHNAVPNVYPVDLFERIFAIDRLQRLGIAQYFKKEIKDALDYVYRYFSNHGISWARGATLQDIDDTSMGFRLLRQHGYNVTEDVFKQFQQKNGEFVCLAGQSDQAVTGMYNFYRASQTRFPGEALLQAGELFARDFLVEKHTKNSCFDKWIIQKDLAGEVGYALKTPWHCSLPWMENQSYVNQYGSDDVWIGKTFYRMPYVHNELFLALAKANLNICQSIHERDLQTILRWKEECSFGRFKFSYEKSYEAYFIATNLLPFPELSLARLVLAKTYLLTMMVDDYFEVGATLADISKFIIAANEWNVSLMDDAGEDARFVFKILYNSINGMTQQDFSTQSHDIGRSIRGIWVRWLESRMKEAEWTTFKYLPSFDEYMEVASPSIALEPIILCSIFFMGEPIGDGLLKNPKMLYLMELVNRVGRLLDDIHNNKIQSLQGRPNLVSIMMSKNPNWSMEDVVGRIEAIAEDTMQHLVQEVHASSPIPLFIRQIHFDMARVMHLFYKQDGIFIHPQ